MIASVSPSTFELITSSRVPTTTTSAMSGFAIDTRVTPTGVVSGYERPAGRSRRVICPGCALAGDATPAISVKQPRTHNVRTAERTLRRTSTEDYANELVSLGRNCSALSCGIELLRRCLAGAVHIHQR